MRGRGEGARRTVGPRGVRGVRLIAAAALAIAAALVPVATPSLAADCVPRTIEDAQSTPDIMFVGDIVRLENGDRWAVVLVTERWQGAAGVPDTVNVRGGPEEGTAMINDRIYTMGRYLFDVRNFGPYMEDDACSATTPWTEALAQYRPSNVAGSSGSGSPFDAVDSTTVVLAAGLVLALLIAVVAYILILRRRQRPPDWMR
jgi:hypothetical protein